MANETQKLLGDIRKYLKSAVQFSTKEAPLVVKDLLEDKTRRTLWGISLPAFWLLVSAAFSGWSLYHILTTIGDTEGWFFALLLGAAVVAATSAILVDFWLDLQQIKHNPRSWLLSYVSELMDGVNE